MKAVPRRFAANGTALHPIPGVTPKVDHAERLARFEAAASPVVTPSLLDCDFARIADELDALERAGAVAVHLDVMDGHFVPNLSYGPPVIRDWRPRTSLFFDAHLMISEPDRYVDAFAQAGCDAIIVHIEVLDDPVPLLRHIRSLGCQAALALNPPTRFDAIAPFLTEVDKVLVMSVMPGFGGQAFEPEVLGKVRAIRRLRPTLPIAIDGGIKAGNAAEVVAAGVTQLVVGSAIFRPDGDYAAALREIEHAGSLGRGPASPGSPAPE